VFSHAGLTNKLWKKYSSLFVEQGETETKLEFFDRVMKVVSNEAIEAANSNNNVELFGAGWDRGGYQQYGGINWVDWNTFGPVNGINQIVGHSIHRVPQILLQHKHGGFVKQDVTEHYKLLDAANKLDKPFDIEYLSVSYNLDTESNHYAVVEDINVDIFHIDTGINLKNVKEIYLPDSSMSGL
jgi:hypothetical protein